MKTKFTALFLLSCFCFLQQNIAQDTISVDLTKTYQTIDGFGGKDFPTNISYLTDDLGMSVVRLVVSSGFKTSEAGAYNFNAGLAFEEPNLADIINQLTAKGMKNYYVTPFTPPGFMKYIESDAGTDGLWNRLSNGLGPQSNFEDGLIGEIGAKKNFYPQYADYLVEFCKQFKQTFGFEIRYLSMQNEPAFPQWYSSCVFDAKQMRDLIRLVGPRLDAAGLTTKIMAPEDMGSYSTNYGWMDVLLKDSVCKKYIGCWAVHSYIDGIAPDLGSADGWSSLYNEVHKNNLPLWMTETSGYSSDWKNGGFKLAQGIYLALKFGKISAWAYNRMDVSEDYWLDETLLYNGNPIAPYYGSKHFYKYINPGAIQIESGSSSKKLLVTTFKNPISKLFTMVVLNFDSVSAHTAKFLVPGLSTTMHMYTTSETQNWADMGNVNINAVSFPKNSVSTFTYQGTNASPVIDPINDIVIVKNSASNKVQLTGISDGDNGSQTISITAISADNTLIANPTISKISNSVYELNLIPQTDKSGNTTITLAIQDNGSSDLFNTTYKTINVKVIPFINSAPTINPIADQTFVQIGKKTIQLVGVTDGNDGSQFITGTITSSGGSQPRSLRINNNANAIPNTITFFADSIGTYNMTITLKDNGGNDLGGIDTKSISFKINIVKTLDIEEQLNSSFFISPNPADDFITIQNPYNFEINNYSIIDQNGKIIKADIITSIQEIIDVNELQSGLYILIAKGEKNIIYRKFIKK